MYLQLQLFPEKICRGDGRGLPMSDAVVELCSGESAVIRSENYQHHHLSGM
jgi:hypothetical protein